MSKPQLPFDPQVNTFGDRILEIESTKLSYKEAYKNPTYVDKALDLENASASDTDIPIEFTQYVLRRMAVFEVDSHPFSVALDPRAEKYLQKLIGPQDSEVRQVHPAEPAYERCNLFRSLFIKLFCQKVITNLQNADCECNTFNKFARIFPFQISRNVPEYKIGIVKNFDERFYNRMQHFLDQHFDKKPPARETIVLFMNNIRHFFETKFSSKEQSTEYLSTFPRLNDIGIFHFQTLYREYRNVRKHFYNCKRRVPHLYKEDEDFRRMPEKNIDEISSLLQTIEFRTKPEMYFDIFEKYLFFFVHTLEAEKNPTPVFFIDDMLYHCLRSIRRFRTIREDMNMIDDIAMITLLWFVGQTLDLDNWNCYTIDLETIRNIKEYITTFVSNEDNKPNVQFDLEYKTELFCDLPFRVNNTICFAVSYTTKKFRCQRGIMYFLDRLLSSVLSPYDDPIKSIVCYSAFLGQENRFEIPQDIVESVRNFVRLSTALDVSKFSSKPADNVYLSLLHGRLVSPDET